MKSLEVARQLKSKLLKSKSTEAHLYPGSARRTGCLIIGQPGTGKTRHLEGWIMDDILAGRGVGVFDVHGQLFHNILYRLGALVDKNPRLAERLVIIDPTSQSDYLVTLNPLAALNGIPLERVATFMSDVLIKIWNINPAESPRLAYLMAQTFLALADLGLSLLALPRFLGDKQWRDGLIPQLTHDGVRNYFTYEFPTSPKEIQIWINPLLNKVGPILFDPQLALCFAAKARLTFRQMMDRQKVLLVHLPKGVIGEGAAALLGALIMAMIQKAALSRQSSPYLRQFYLYLDEFQNYTTTHISDALAESRKFGLTLIMAHQFSAQIRSEELKSAVLNTTGTLISFRIGYQDARSYGPNIFPYADFLAEQGITGWEGLAAELANLPNRVYWLRRRGPYLPIRKYTREMPDPVVTPQIEANLVRMLEISGRIHGHHRNELRQKLARVELDQVQSPSSSRRKRRRKKKARQTGDQSVTLVADVQPGKSADHIRAKNGRQSQQDEFWHD